jgi:hypothetical protein
MIERSNDSGVFRWVEFCVKVALVLWMLAYGSAALALLVNGWLHDYSWLGALLRTADPLPQGLADLFHVIIGGVMGSCVGGMVNFHHYESMKSDFQLQHAWGYVIGPWVSAFVAVGIYALISAGLIAFGASLGSGQRANLPELSFFATGFVSGLGWYEAVTRVQKVARRIFGGAKGDPGLVVGPSSPAPGPLRVQPSDELPEIAKDRDEVMPQGSTNRDEGSGT